MTSHQFEVWATEIVSTLSFAWTQTKPEMLHTIHRLALASSPATSHIDAPFDIPVHDLVTNTQIRPSEMQRHLLSTVVPGFLPSIQAVAEDVLNDSMGGTPSIFTRIENACVLGSIDRSLASRAHHWRIVRNVLAHGGGVISKRTEDEVGDLHARGLIDFTKFNLWGPLIDAGCGGTLVPIHAEAVSNPTSPTNPIVIPALEGLRMEIGLGDLLAASKIWSRLIQRICSC